ncbi:hypothetical protein MLD38_023963 [Melastoma candidum]|uniref:Uncharacterized protein n=1 Tax=Melastoma candidum TaxID=119954 RepID=A0ACB9NQW3_9MYRT|nr:hypothetical protein MLD38_023963 [Melastoma candidum]
MRTGLPRISEARRQRARMRNLLRSEGLEDVAWSSTKSKRIHLTSHDIYSRCMFTSLGYRAPGLRDGSKPDHPSMLSLFLSVKNLSGSKSSGLSQKYGDRWRLYT